MITNRFRIKPAKKIMIKVNEFKINNEDENTGISFTQLIMVFWRERKMIAAITLAATAIGIGVTLAFPTYTSVGYLQIGSSIPIQLERKKDFEASQGITMSDYKRYSAAFNTSERFNDFVQEYKLDSQTGIDQLRGAFSSRKGISSNIEPIYPFTKLDAKDLVMEQPKNGSNNIIGVLIRYENKDPVIAKNMVELLGRYTLDSIMYIFYADLLRYRLNEIDAKIIRLENDILENNMNLEEYERRSVDLKKIIARHPEANNTGIQAIVSVTEENSRFLAPRTQLMTTEVQMSEANEKNIRARYNEMQYRILREYYLLAKKTLDSTRSGETMLHAMTTISDTVFKNKNLKDENVQKVYNKISMDNKEAINVFHEQSRFIAGPSLPKNRSTSLSKVTIVSFMAGLILSLILAFGRDLLATNRMKQQD